MSDLLTQLEEYGRQLDAEAAPLSGWRSVATTPRSRSLLRPVLVAAAAALATILLIGGVALLLRGETVEPAEPVEIPETWTTWTSADGLVSECLCEMVMASDGSILLVGYDGIAHFDGSQWERIEPPRPFSGEGWPAVATAPDGSVWISGMSYLAHYVHGSWEPPIEAGYGMDEGDPLSFEGLEIDDTGQVWVRLDDQDGVIVDGAFLPRERPDEPQTGFVPPEGLGILASDSRGSVWMNMGDSIVGVDGALVEFDGESYTAYDLGGVEAALFGAEGTGWFIVPQIGEDAWMFGREQWSDPGLYRLDDDEWFRITTDDGLGGYRVSTMLMDHEGALWLSTADGTVTRYQPGTDPQSGTHVEIGSRPLPEVDFPPPAYPPTTIPSITIAPAGRGR